MVDTFPPTFTETDIYGVLPVDFLLETVIAAGLTWFKTDPTAYQKVYGHLYSPYLNAKYGEAKALEIKNFIIKYDIKIVQSFALIDHTVPSISIQLLDATERTDRAGFQDFAKEVNTLDMNGMLLSRNEVSYSPIQDNVHIGIHVQNTPDLAKYIYYLVIYILNTFKPRLEEQGLKLGTFNATDISKLNEYLPENLYSRFINFSVYTPAIFDRGVATLIANIIGVSANQLVTTPTIDYNLTFDTIGDTGGTKA